ncbi:fas apoptotic inhibitory molecule b isoform X1 [Channa argus]|uniref:fas apoptotic inhibitory molecule b isoform X1 n=1 Tax=Channa argus TaxID=215402 RepID=UPI003520ECE7
MLCGDVVAMWEVALSDGLYRIEFAHGTTTGKRIVYVNRQEVIRKDWMFKLVGKETFTVGGANTKATINIEAVGGFAYEYTLEIDGKNLQKFIDNRAKTTKTWLLKVDGEDFRVVLGTAQFLPSGFICSKVHREGHHGCLVQRAENGHNGRVCGRWHGDPLRGGGPRVLHQGYEQWEEKERHCAPVTAGWGENTSFNTIVLDWIVGQCTAVTENL